MAGYDIFLKTPDGMQGNVIDEFVSFEAVLRLNEIGKWSLQSSGLTQCPFQPGYGVIVYRDGVPLLSGIANEFEVNKNEISGITDWKVSGEEDTSLLKNRIIVPDPVNLDFTSASHYVYTGPCDDAILECIRVSGAELAREERKIKNLFTAANMSMGMIDTWRIRFGELYQSIRQIANENGFCVRITWDKLLGHNTAEVFKPVDKSESVIFSYEYGNLKSWKRKWAAPKANFIWCAGEGQGTSRMIVSAQDDESIERWGRIEIFKDHRDISDETELRAAAAAFLEECKATESYQAEIIPVENMQYRTNWDLGDVVTVAPDQERFTAAITEVKISYADLTETITPTIGKLNEGILSPTKALIESVSDRVAILEGVE